MDRPIPIPRSDQIDYAQSSDDSCRTTSWIVEHFGLSLDPTTEDARDGLAERRNRPTIPRSLEARPAVLKSAMRSVSRTSSIPSSPDSYSDAEPYMWSSISSFSIDESSTAGCKTPKSVRFDEDAVPEVFATWNSEAYDRRPIEPATAEERSCELPPACRADTWLKAKVIKCKPISGPSSNTNPCPQAENWGMSDSQYGPEESQESDNDLSACEAIQDDAREESSIDLSSNEAGEEATDETDDETNTGHATPSRHGMCAMGNCTRTELYTATDVLGGF